MVRLMKKALLKLSLLAVLFGGTAVAWGVLQYQKFLEMTVFSDLPMTLEVKKGSHFGDFIQQLKSRQAEGAVWQWRLLARLNPDKTMIKAGEFELNDAMTPLQLLNHINSNRVKTYSYTLIEGLQWREIKPQLLEQWPELNLDDKSLRQALNLGEVSLEGQFLPETYQFTKNEGGLSVLKRANRELQAELQLAWQQMDKSLPINTPYELLILASIIEKETALDSEREQISGVFHRRLQKGMKLQTDPTVIYGLGEQYQGNITKAHLQTDTEYNTYTRKGLPPTPIAMPGAASIRAAANPVAGTALFFVADGKGGHTFSDTYQQHRQAVKNYLRQLK